MMKMKKSSLASALIVALALVGLSACGGGGGGGSTTALGVKLLAPDAVATGPGGSALLQKLGISNLVAPQITVQAQN